MADNKKKFFLIIKPNDLVLKGINENYQTFFKEELFNENILENNFNILKIFLDENIFKLEKKYKLYVEDINLIIEHKNFITINLSLIKNFQNLLIQKDILKNDLSNIKYSVLKSNADYQLAHMIINRYIVDGNEFLILPEQSNKKNIFIEIKFICLAKNIINNFQTILSKYQISVQNVSSYEYVKSFDTDPDKKDCISVSADKLIQGYNSNEINFIKKYPRNSGLFEKFFRIFN